MILKLSFFLNNLSKHETGIKLSLKLLFSPNVDDKTSFNLSFKFAFVITITIQQMFFNLVQLMLIFNI
jgi:hypothetical protein